MISLLASVLLFAGISLGLFWPWVSRLSLDPAEKLASSALLSTLGIFLVAWIVYVAALPTLWLGVLPVAGTLGLVTGWRSLSAVLKDPDARTLAIGQVGLSLWSLGWLALVLSYSGGGWAVDWWSHWQRTLFFLEHGPKDIRFGGFDALTSRPPLANVVNGALLALTQRDFAHYQFFSTLLGSLVFLPAGLLARRFGGARAIAVLAVLFMISPLYVENVTYAWTKLPAAFFTLAALYFFLRTQDAMVGPVNAGLFALSLSAALLTHYSAGPYALLLGVAWLGFGQARRKDPAWWRLTALMAFMGAVVLATWFSWAFAVYGWHGTVLTNTSITDQAPSVGAQLQVAALNLRDTLVPHFLRSVDFSLVDQRSPAGWWRDWFFQLYQLNAFFALGSVAWAAMLVRLLRERSQSAPGTRNFWTWFIVGGVLLGVGVHGARDTWGLAQICLQPLILLGLVFLAAQWSTLGRPWRLALIAGAAVDFVLGILLQFGAQAGAWDKPSGVSRSIVEITADYTQSAQMNFYAKAKNHWVFVGDVFITHRAAVVVLLAILFFIALRRAIRLPAELPPTTGPA